MHLNNDSRIEYMSEELFASVVSFNTHPLCTVSFQGDTLCDECVSQHDGHPARERRSGSFVNFSLTLEQGFGAVRPAQMTLDDQSPIKRLTHDP